MDLKHIRNFSIIAHIDHGKSTLADRMLEITHTIETRKMRDQVLDSMDLERERGITIKMQPVRMEFTPLLSEEGVGGGEKYILNLIDTPGHIDFSYEVSRALKAVEGSILLIDSTQGVQAQTLTTLAMAREGGLKIIPVLSKIDSPLSRVSEVKEEVVELLNCDPSEILLVSGRTGEGVENLLQEVVKRIPPPVSAFPPPKVGGGVGTTEGVLRALVFDFKYSNHRGVIVFVRVLDGKVGKGDTLLFAVSKEKFIALEVGTFSPEETPRDNLSAGDTGYIVTGIKKPGIASVGDTITMFKNPLPAFPGYMQPLPVVWASVFPEDADDFAELKLALGKLKLSDSAFSYEEESSGSLGKGFRCGFLGMLHLEIITERLRREFNLKLVITTPSITYEVILKNGKKEKIYSPYFFPDDGNVETVFEPWVKLKIITPVQYIGNIMQLLFDHEGEIGETENFGDPEGKRASYGAGNRNIISALMPLRELMRNFFDELKSTTSGYGSISYSIGEMREANVTRLDLLVADEIVPAFSRVVSKKRAEVEAEEAVVKLDNLLPRQMFSLKIQGKALGRIISSRTKSGMKKDVTQHMYGGDITRKMKLREKQKKGKKKMKERGRVNIPQDVFLKMMRASE